MYNWNIRPEEKDCTQKHTLWSSIIELCSSQSEGRKRIDKKIQTLKENKISETGGGRRGLPLWSSNSVVINFRIGVCSFAIWCPSPSPPGHTARPHFPALLQTGMAMWLNSSQLNMARSDACYFWAEAVKKQVYLFHIFQLNRKSSEASGATRWKEPGSLNVDVEGCWANIEVTLYCVSHEDCKV